MKKALALILILVLSTSLLAACGSPSATNSAIPSSSEENTADSASGGNDSPKTELVVMSVSGAANEPMNNIVNANIATFNESNELNVTISMEILESEQYKSKIATLMAANAQPDIFYTWEGGFLRPFVEGGKVYPVGDAIDADPEWKGRFLSGVFDPVTYSDGKVYAVPSTMQCGVMYYNTRIFQENNLSEPTSWDEFINICEILKSKGIVPISMPSEKSWIASELLQEICNGVGGADLFNKISNGETTWDEERFVKAGEVFQDMVNKGYFQQGFLGMSQDQGRDMFRNEQAAMYFMGCWDNSAVSDPSFPLSKNISLFKLPSYDSANNGTILGSIGYPFAISATAKNIEAACSFLKMMSNQDAQENFLYEQKSNVVTNIDIDESRMDPLTLKTQKILNETTNLTPWYDRVFGAGEGTEFNNVAIAIAAGESVEDQMKSLEQFAVDNGAR